MRQRNRSLERLAAFGPPPPRRRWPWVVGVVVLALAAGGGAWYLTARGHQNQPTTAASSAQAAHHGSTSTTAPAPLTVTSVSPSAGATGVPSNTTIEVHFSAPLPTAVPAGAAAPTLAPPVAGTWQRANATTLRFVPSAPFISSTAETLTIPGGASGIQAKKGQTLAASDTVSFTIAKGSELRLQQLLALTNYLPLSFTPSGPAPAPQDMGLPQPGTFAWRWPNLPVALTGQWIQGTPSDLTIGAVMSLQNQNNIPVDGDANSQVWATLLHDVATSTTDQQPYTYVYVSKVLPESLTIWVNGNPQFQNIPVNTGAPGADTTDGTYEVFEHVQSSDMKGTNPNGTTYNDPNVPWASYFNGGDALHGFVRATYGSPQSNGCVEMSIANAGATWPYTTIGTLVTVAGPAVT